MESVIGDKIDQTEYNSKISSIETSVSNVETSVSNIERRIDTTIFKDCLGEQIEYKPYVLVST